MQIKKLHSLGVASLLLMSYQAQSAVFNPANIADLIANINTANLNGVNDEINLGNLTFNLLAANNATNGQNGLPSILADGGSSLTIHDGTIRRDASLSDTPGDNEHFRIFHVGAGAELILNKVTLSNGLAAVANNGFGGAIYNLGSLTITNSKLVDNHALEQGGAIKNINGTVVEISDSEFNNNVADGDGGAIDSQGGPITLIKNTIFKQNLASSGGSNDGGAINLHNSVLSLIQDSTFDANRADEGGAIYLTGGQDNSSILRILGTTFVDNQASVAGGALFLGRVESIEQSTFSHNIAPQGGGIYAEEQSFGLVIYNSTLTLNEASNSGGGIYVHADAPAITTLRSTIVAQNESSTGPDIFNGPDNIGNESFNLIGDNSDSGLAAGAPNVNDSLIGTADDEIDAHLKALDDNGGHTKTHALRHKSQAINAGENPLNFEFDQRGDDYLRIVGASTDIGAYEFRPRQKHNDEPGDSDNTAPVILPPIGAPIPLPGPGIFPPTEPLVDAPLPAAAAIPEVSINRTRKPELPKTNASVNIADVEKQDSDGGCQNTSGQFSVVALIIAWLARKKRQ